MQPFILRRRFVAKVASKVPWLKVDVTCDKHERGDEESHETPSNLLHARGRFLTYLLHGKKEYATSTNLIGLHLL